MTNDPARILITIDGEGPYEVIITGPLADLDAVADALRNGIRAAHSSPSFNAAEAIRTGNQVLVLPGSSGAAIAFAPFPSDPASEELGLNRITPVSGRLSSDLSTFAGITNDPARIELTIGQEGPHTVSILGSPGDLSAASTALQVGIRDAHTSDLFKKALVAKVGERLLVLHGIKKIRFPISGVEAGDYLVRAQVDGAQSGLITDVAGRYIGPRITVP
jgi:hypothetical protein